MPHSQLIHRSPRVRKQATARRAWWWIQPSCLSWVMMASIQGKPVRPSAHLAKASGFWSQGIWRPGTHRSDRRSDVTLHPRTSEEDRVWGQDPPGHRWGSPPCGQSWGCWWPPCRRTPSTTTVQTETGGDCSLYAAEGRRGTKAQEPIHVSNRRRNVPYLNVELSEVVVQNPTGQTAEAQVGAEACRTGVQRTGVDPRVLQVGHPHLQQHQDTGETQQRLRLLCYLATRVRHGHVNEPQIPAAAGSSYLLIQMFVEPLQGFGLSSTPNRWS